MLALIDTFGVFFAPAERVTDCRVAKDNKYLELALTAGACTIVSGDADLLGAGSLARRAHPQTRRLPRRGRGRSAIDGTPPALLPASSRRLVSASGPILPALVIAAGDRASTRFLEFFASTIINPHTRRAHARAVGDSLTMMGGC